MSKKVILSLTIIIGILAALLLLKSNQLSGSEEGPKIVIAMNEDTFEPSEIEIKKGAKVIFKNQSSQTRWPASNLHPLHDIYPEFDPKKGIQPGEEWSFVFDKEGTWKYHDHLLPYLRGVVKVTE